MLHCDLKIVAVYWGLGVLEIYFKMYTFVSEIIRFV